MELRSRQLPDKLSQPQFMAGQRKENELFGAVAFEPTTRCRSAPNTPTELDTTNKVGFPPVPHLNEADFDEEARDFARNRLFAPIPQRGRDNPRRPEMPILRPTPRINNPQRPMYEGEGQQTGFHNQSRYIQDHLRNTGNRDQRNAPAHNPIMTDFKPRAPIFDGKVDSWEPFIMQLRFMCKTYCWPEWKFHEQLLFALRGEALQFAATLNPTVREDSVLLLGALEQRFGQSLLAETYRANLYNIKKTSKESIQEYSNQLMTRAYPGMDGTAIYNNLLIEHLLKGMPDQRLAYEVLTRKPRNLNEAVDMITWHEACRQYTMKTSDIRMVKSDELGEPSEDQFAKDHELRGVKNRKVTQEDDYNSQLSQLHKDL